MDTTKPTCADVAEHDLVERYITGRLDQEAAEALEEHYFSCDACWERVREASELRAAFSDRAGSAVRGTAKHRAPGRSLLSRWKVWIPLAAAAAVGALFFGAKGWDLGRGPPATAVIRGGGEVLTVETTRETDGVRISWTALGEADSYELRVFSEAGALLTEELTRDAELVVGGGVVAAWAERAGNGGNVYARIVARNREGSVLAESALVPIPSDRERPPSR